MKNRFVITLLASAGFAFASQTPAHAIGCISGGLAGGVAGHMAHHGVLGAIGGCIAGHELHKGQQRRAAMQNQDNGQYSPNTTYPAQPSGNR